MKNYKWGIIGPGNIAHHFAEDMKLVKPTQKLEAVFSDHKKSANEFADRFHIAKRFTSLDDFIDKSSGDIAISETSEYYKIELAISSGLILFSSLLCYKSTSN